jgi:hypothetical protein
MNSLEKVRQAKKFLEGSGIEDAEREAELIVAHCLGTERLMLYKDNPAVTDMEFLFPGRKLNCWRRKQ